MPVPLIPIAIAILGRAAISRYLAGGAGAAVIKATNAGKAVKGAGSAGKAGKAVTRVKPKAIPKKVKGGSPAASTKPSGRSAGRAKKIKGQTQNPTSGRGSGLRRHPIGPNMVKGKNSFTPAQKGQITKNANKAKAIRGAKDADAAKAARAKAADQKKAVAARNAKVTKAAPYAAAGAVAAGAGGMTMAARREKQQKVKSAEKGLVWNGQRYVKK